MVLAILSVVTSNRRCEYSHAITLPFLSTIVETAGTSPWRSWAEPLATTSEARLDISPTPPTNGNISAAAKTLANKQHPASLRTVRTAGGRSDMRTRVAAPRHPATPRCDQRPSPGITSEFIVEGDESSRFRHREVTAMRRAIRRRDLS